MSFQIITTVLGTLVTSKTVLDATGQVCRGVKELFKHNDIDINASLEGLDLQRKLDTLNSIMYKLQHTEERTIKETITPNDDDKKMTTCT